MPVVLRCALLVLSFFGLNSLVEDRLRLNDAPLCAPLITNCCIMLVLMLAGLVGVLPIACYALYISGWLGLVWVYAIRRRKVDRTALVALLAGLLYACLHYRGFHFKGNDSVAHWALAAKYLLRTNRFPDASATMIYFPSYPLAVPAYLYYTGHATGISAAGFLAAQMWLYWTALLPLLAFARRNRVLGLTFGGIMMVFLIALNRYHYSLQVDALMGYLTLGATCVIGLNRDQRAPCLLASLLVALALVFVKASGVVLALLIAGIAAAQAGRPTKRHAWITFAVFGAIVVAAALIWQIHVRVAFAGVDAGKHALSLSNYRSNIGQKGWRMILSIGKQILVKVVSPVYFLPIPLLFVLAFVIARAGRLDGKVWTPQLKKMAVFIVAVSAAWYVMLYAMYVFTMSVSEAQSLASFRRYQSTVVFYLIGVLAILILSEISSMELPWKRIVTVGVSAAMIVATVVIGLLPISWGGDGKNLAAQLLDGRIGREDEFAYITSLRERNDVEEGKRYIAFVDVDDDIRFVHRATKYEFFSNDILMIYHNPDSAVQEGKPEFYAAWTRAQDESEKQEVDDVLEFLEEQAGQYDYLLVYSANEEIEAAADAIRQERPDGIRICYSYRDS